MGLGKLIPKRLLCPWEASTALPIAWPGGVVRKISWDVPEIIRVVIAAGAWAEPIDSRCLAMTSSAVIFCATVEREAKQRKNKRQMVNETNDCFLADTTLTPGQK